MTGSVARIKVGPMESASAAIPEIEAEIMQINTVALPFNLGKARSIVGIYSAALQNAPQIGA